MTLRLRLTLLFLVMALLAVGTGLGTMGSMDELEEALSDARSSHRRQLASERLKAEILDTSQELTAFLAGDTAARPRYEQKRSQVNALLEQLRAPDATGPEAKFTRALAHDVESYELAAERALFLAKRGQDDVAFARMRDWISDELFPSVNGTVQAMLNYHRDRVELSSSRALQGRRTMARLAYVGFALLLALVVAGYMLIRSWLVVPIDVLGQATRDISAGRLRSPIPVRRDDELGHLARDVERMGRSIADYQQQLVEKERLAAVGEMTASVAHNFKNPLASIRALSQGARRELAEDHPLQPVLASVMDCVDRITEKLKYLMGVLQPVRLTRAPVDMNRALREVAEASAVYAERKSVALVLELQEGLPEAVVDRLRVDQALLAIVTNALDASPGGQTVTLRSRLAEGGGALDVEVEDHGPGMSAEVLAKAFDPYFSTKKGGTGVGLSLAKRIIFGHQGSLTARTEPGEGCCMLITLPLGQAEEGERNGAGPDPG